MGDSADSADPLKQIITLLRDHSGYVAVILAFVASVLGIPGPLPKTTALITVVITVITVWSLRWPKITALLSQVPDQILVVGKYERKVPKSIFERIIDPLRTSAGYPYKMGLERRRVEVGLLALLSVVSLGFGRTQVLGSYVELGGTYCPNRAASELRVVITKFDIPPDSIFDRRLFDSMDKNLHDVATVCWLNRIVYSAAEAADLGRELRAAIVIRGNEDPQLSEVHIDATYWDAFGDMRAALPEEKSIFQADSRQQIPFLTQFVLSEILYMDGKQDEARIQLKALLEKAATQDWSKKYPEDLADGYNLLGLLYEADNPQSENLQPAIRAFSEAIRLNPSLDRAYLNRCQLHIYDGQLKAANNDCSTLIEKESFLSPFALLLRAQTQSDWDAAEQDLHAALESGMIDLNTVSITRGLLLMTKWKDYAAAITEFTNAIAREPKRVILYHYLGIACLQGGELDRARTTYNSVYPYVSQEDREAFILELKELMDSDESKNERLNKAVLGIIKGLETGSFP